MNLILSVAAWSMFASHLQNYISWDSLFAGLVFSGIWLPVGIALLIILVGGRLQWRVGWVATLAPLLNLILFSGILLHAQPGASKTLEIAWVPSMGVNLSFLVDGLSLFYVLVISGIGLLVCIYSTLYLDRERKDHQRFYGYLLLFMAAMTGTVLSDNLLLLFFFWEITSVTSFLLIGYLYENEESRYGARRALLVTAITGLCLLAGVIMLGLSAGGTYSWTAISKMPLSELGGSRTWIHTMFLLLMLGAWGKSAQFPFHFWLPGAMVAPTPVSTYLHSATMVKLGVFLTARMLPIFGELEIWFPVVASVGFATMLLGSWLALRSNDMKAILAYSTISLLGMLIGFYGLGPIVGVTMDLLHILTHVLYKASLFMMVGIVDHATGIRDIRQLGGLWRRLPLAAFVTLLGAAAMAGFPLTIGFISKEALLGDLLKVCEVTPVGGYVLLGVFLLSMLMMVGVALRLVCNVFLGRQPDYPDYHNPGIGMQLPPFVLSLGVLLFGVFPGCLDGFLETTRVAGLHKADTAVHLALWHGWNTAFFLSIGLFVAGYLLYLWAEKCQWRWTTIPRWLHFAEAFDALIDELVYQAKRLTHFLRADSTPSYLPIVITFLLVAMGSVTVSYYSTLQMNLSQMDFDVHPLRLWVMLLVTVALIGVVYLRRWSAQLVALSVAGFFTTFYFVIYRAPDLAMTQVLVESASVVMILFLLSRFPSSTQSGMRFDFGLERRHIFRMIVSLGVGLLMGSLVMFADFHRHPKPVGYEILERTQELADGSNAVNTILVDFRGFDTLGEITVLLIATIGGLGLMMRYKRGKNPVDPKPPPGFLIRKEDHKL
jgi:NADH:ubiquinone oxidoreductase subunit 5 (subunit L)/multisubunit Na+/H+ antiporter MnhA subunit